MWLSVFHYACWHAVRWPDTPADYSHELMRIWHSHDDALRDDPHEEIHRSERDWIQHLLRQVPHKDIGDLNGHVATALRMAACTHASNDRALHVLIYCIFHMHQRQSHVHLSKKSRLAKWIRTFTRAYTPKITMYAGALRIAAEFISMYTSKPTVYISDPSWGNHHTIFQKAGLQTKTYRYLSPQMGLDAEGMLADLRLVHASCARVRFLCACVKKWECVRLNERKGTRVYSRLCFSMWWTSIWLTSHA